MPPNLPTMTHDPSKPLPGRVGNLTVIQQHTLDKFKKELQEEGHFVPERHDDSTLLRFLRARKFDLVKAKEMLISAEEWRKAFGVDAIVQDFEFKEQAEVDKYYPQYYHKTDKDGRPLYIERLGKLDIKALYNITTQERLLQHLVFEYEKCFRERFPTCSAEVGHHVETSCTVMDLQNVGLGQFYKVKDYVMQAAAIGQDRYPESMGKFYLVNTPFLFSTLWSIIKTWLDEVTVTKIHILGRDYKKELLAQIPAENLPKDLGGTCECEGGCSLSDSGPWNKHRGEVEKITNGVTTETPGA